jgi:fructokinase
MSTAIYAGVEMGGTKCVCVLGTGPDDVREQQIVPTGDPAPTLNAIAEVLQRWSIATADLAAIGVAAFGPIDLRRESRTYGRIGNTPKERWKDVDLAGFFNQRFGLQVGFTTDVIGAALAEGRWGGARGLTDFAYVTVGTGVGVGVVVAGAPFLGRHHPELGHVRVARAVGDCWPGNCRFHGDCVEGLASGPAIEARSGGLALDLPRDSPIWDTVAQALGQLAHILVLLMAPQRIVMGGGVLSAQPHLFPRIRSSLATNLNGYLNIPQLGGGMDAYVVPPGLGTRAGPLGALALAADFAAQRSAAGLV